jgi:hypothetical protein
MGEEKHPEQREVQTEKHPDTEAGKDATEEKVEEEEKSGGALPQNHSDES